jgi:DNA-binding response OmpR family regulator/KaiC/GvpD/RAD55 family RecA-like ATPase
MMEKTARDKVSSGIEPVDKLLGGLDGEQLYLIHGEAAGKSLFGIKFLIEGLKRGENGALVIRYSPEDAVRRFARLGYDCLEDVYGGRLVILEYSDDVIRQISRLPELTPVLRELEWLLGETRPQRLVIDPVKSLIASEEGDLAARAAEFAQWARSFGATGVLVANGDSNDIVESFRPHVAEVFRFEVREAADLATRFLVFEKSQGVADQPIEVDPSRGVFLLGRAQTGEQASEQEQPPPVQPDAPPATGRTAELASSLTTELDAVYEGPLVEPDLSELLEPLEDLQLIEDQGEELLDASEAAFESADAESKALAAPPAAADLESPPLTQQENDAAFEPVVVKQLETTRLELPFKPPAEETSNEPAAREDRESAVGEGPAEITLSDLIEELSNAASPLDLEMLELEPAEEQEEEEPSAQLLVEEPARAPEQKEPEEELPRPVSSPVEEEAAQRRHGRAADRRIDSTIAARAVEILLRPPESEAGPHPAAKAIAPSVPPRPAAQAAPVAAASVNPKDFNILVIDDDPVSCEQVAQALGEYTVEIVHDGVSGLAKLISFKPDLVILDVDLPIVDGFKVLAHIRSSLNMPIVILSGTRVRASDRMLSAELGADYFMTKPFSGKELQQKARQLIARYRGINSWIITAPAAAARPAAEQPPAPKQGGGRIAEPVIMSIESGDDQFTPYEDFAVEIERRVRVAMDDGEPFSIVGCRLPRMTSNGGHVALRLFEMVSTLVRDTDLISTNPRNDLVILLADADASGARAFINRLRERVLVETNHEPSVWLRSFPELEEATEAAAPPRPQTNGNRRRVGDNPERARRVEFKYPPDLAPPRPGDRRGDAPARPDPRESYVDFLEHL